MKHTRHGYWLEEAGGVEPAPTLSEERRADIIVIGGGYTGMWAAWHIKKMEPEASVVLLEGDVCGRGSSGRNGGFCNSMWFSLPNMRERWGDAGALAVAQAARDAIDGVEAFCREEGVDAWFRRGGYLQVSTAPAHDGVWDEAVAACREPEDADATLRLAESPTAAGSPADPIAPAVARPPADPVAPVARALSPAEVAERCASPAFRGGAFYRDAATVQPARLALGLRARLLEAGVAIYERSPVRRLSDDWHFVPPIGGKSDQLRRGGGVEARTDAGAVRAGAAIVAIGGAAKAPRGPLRDALTVTSSHIVLTEPVPDVLEEIGWTGGECITDARTLIDYFRTTPDGRIAFGWGGGRIAMGARLHGRAELDADVIAAAAARLREYFPMLEEGVPVGEGPGRGAVPMRGGPGRGSGGGGCRPARITHAWGGPIDVSPTHLPVVVPLPGGKAFAAAGYTGNGVGPSYMVARTLASLALDRRDDHARLPIVDPSPQRVPPEPLHWLGGAAIRKALIHKEEAELADRSPSPLSSLIARVPQLIGFHIGR
jgi:glycine/D-amino acid oxidase-like deaminating enzyme